MADSNLSSGIIQAGDVEFISLYLINPKNKNERYNLFGSFVDFTIYEDLFSPVLSGYVAIIETQNLLSLVPITGEELIHGEFRTPTMKTITVDFHITKVGTRVHNDKKSAYTLELISTEGFTDVSTRVSKAFSGNTGAIVNKVFKDYFKKSLIDSDVSNNSIKFVSPYWGPMKVINHATSRAVFQNNKLVTPNYLFYQTNKGHKFKSISNLLSAKPVTEYFFDKNPARTPINSNVNSQSSGSSTRDIDREYKSIIELSFVGSQDILKNMMDGAYHHQVFNMNMLNKKVGVKSYEYTNDFNKTIHTDKYPLTVLPVSDSDGLMSVHPTYPQLFTGVDDISADIKAKRISLLAQLETWKIDITVHGRSDLEVGNTIIVYMNKFQVIDSTDKYASDEYDRIYSGVYLITAIVHRFTMAKYEMTLQCIKDSSFSKI